MKNITTIAEKVTLQKQRFNGELFYKITNSNLMRPFFMSIVSDSNHWMFISSNGGLSAGRKNSDYALFPYYTDDKITESSETTGSKSIFWVQKNNKKYLWEPFSIRQKNLYHTTQNVYKNEYGNKIIFEEENHDLKLTFRYQWNSSDTYGFIRKATLSNNALKEAVYITVVDGIQNIMPYGVLTDTQNAVSNLVDAYKRNELLTETGLGIYALSAIIVDKAEPSEALKANIVWSLGLEKPNYLLSSLQLNKFRNEQQLELETDIKAEKGAYFINSEFKLSAQEQKNWMLIANVNQDQSDIVAITNKILKEKNIRDQVENSITEGTKKLIRLNASSDALQLTANKKRNVRHFANTLFNIMRGGVFDYNYQIEKWDFKNYLSKANKKVFAKSKEKIANLPEQFTLTYLKELANHSDDKNFRRLCLEYLPLKFSRRHGDPSRPWNKFSINTRNEDGTKILDYEGNWRDIFQNWEALATAFPDFIESMIHKFLNATTFDGYNPYRVTKDGFDWETIEPDDPWSYIGYWGDHQIIYLLKFLEFLEKHKPGQLANFFTKDLFVYANVPYRIKTYKEIIKNPKDTIDFDEALDEKIRIKRQELGADGALLRDANFFICKVNFIEKILATVLAKLSNFIPEAGIWLNTQRPEWNDANNALVGNGVSMVTLYYMYRFLKFFTSILKETTLKEVEISEELVQFFNAMQNTLQDNTAVLSGTISNSQRKKIVDRLGEAGSKYRETIYNKAFSGNKKTLEIQEIENFIALTLQYVSHTIIANKRSDNMYHAYNLMTVEKNSEISLSHLEVMLEGQVAVLSSGFLSAKDALVLLNALKKSKLFREDQYSYLLYPNKELPRFTEKNNIPKEAVKHSKLLQKLLDAGNTSIIKKDNNNAYHFNGNFNNANSLETALNNLEETTYASLVAQEKEQLLKLFETVFNHKAFTGRSGTFFGYEGLGSIYWHMVSKLQLAVLETCYNAIENNENESTIGKLLEHYYEINEGIGVHKSPKLYGAFPTDPYSHTPAGKGAQQPGMTGQVKEDILSRIGELGVVVKNGTIVFDPCMLRKNEFLKTPKTFSYITLTQEEATLQLAKNSLVFTYCQIPIVYTISSKNSIKIEYENDKTEKIDGLILEKTISSKIFQREHTIKTIHVNVTEDILK